MSVNKYLEKFNQFSGQTDNDLSEMIGGANSSIGIIIVLFIVYFFNSVSTVSSFDKIYKESGLNLKGYHMSILAFSIASIIILFMMLIFKINEMKIPLMVTTFTFVVFFIIYFSLLSYLVVVKMKDSSNDTIKKIHYSVLMPQLILHCISVLFVFIVLFTDKI